MKRISMLSVAMCCMTALAAAQNSGNMNNSGNSSMNQDHMKGEKTVMGCVRSNNGMYMLQEGNGKMAKLTGQTDLSAHVGHTVALHGMWQKSDSAMNAGSNGGSMSGDKSSGSMNGSSSSGDAGMSGSSSGSAMSSDHLKKMKWDHKGKSFMVNSVDMRSASCDMPMKDKSKM